jgi:lysophospholipase L1-like esterase
LRPFLRWVVALALPLAVTLLVAAALVHHRGSTHHSLRVMPLGDSITDGEYVPGGYRTSLFRRLTSAGDHVDFVGSLHDGPSALTDQDHEGHIGWRIDQLRAHIDAYLRSAKPDVVLLDIGTNDVVQNHDLATAPARLADLVSRICVDRPKVHLVVASIGPLPGRDAAVRAYDASIPGIVASARCAATFLDMALPPGDISADGIHPTAAGYLAMADAWYPVVHRLVGSRV